MCEDPDWLPKLRSKSIYLTEWLRRYTVMADVAPMVKKTLDYTNWEIDVVENRPSILGGPSLPDLAHSTKLDLANVQTILPMPYQYTPDTIAGASAFSSTGVIAVFDYTQEFVGFAEADGVDYAEDAKASLEKLDSTYNTHDELRHLIATFGKRGLNDRFSVVSSALESYQIGTSDKTAAAIGMRNLLDGVKGELWSRARTHPSENMTWSLMANRLAYGSIGGPHHDTLLSLESTYTSIIAKLSEIAKDRDCKTLLDPISIWIDVKNFLIAIVGLLRKEQ